VTSAICASFALALPALATGSDTTAGSWAATASMATPRAHVTATRLANGRVLVVGGAEVSTAELYDPPTGTWLPAGTLSEPAGLNVAVRLADGRVLVAGGGWYSARAELYNPATNSWTRTGSMNGYGGTAALLQDGRVLVASSGTGDLYSPAAGTWTETGPMVYPYASGAAALLPNGQVLYVGGTGVKYCGLYSCDEPIADAELYTP